MISPDENENETKPSDLTSNPNKDESGDSLLALEEDLLRIEKMDWKKAVFVRFRRGIHPTQEIENLLARRINLHPSNFKGPYPARLLCTLALVFSSITLVWIGLWIFLSLIYPAGTQWVSSVMSVLLVGTLGFFASQPLGWYDEAEVEKAGEEKIQTLKSQISKKKNETSKIDREPAKQPSETESETSFQSEKEIKKS